MKLTLNLERALGCSSCSCFHSDPTYCFILALFDLQELSIVHFILRRGPHNDHGVSHKFDDVSSILLYDFNKAFCISIDTEGECFSTSSSLFGALLRHLSEATKRLLFMYLISANMTTVSIDCSRGRVRTLPGSPISRRCLISKEGTKLMNC